MHVVRKTAATRKVSEETAEKIVRYLCKPILESSALINNKKRSKHPSKITLKTSSEPLTLKEKDESEKVNEVNLRYGLYLAVRKLQRK